MDHPRSSTMIFGDTFARDFYQSGPLEVNAVADDAIGGITGKIVAQLSSFYCDLRGQGNKLHVRQRQSVFQTNPAPLGPR